MIINFLLSYMQAIIAEVVSSISEPVSPMDIFLSNGNPPKMIVPSEHTFCKIGLLCAAISSLFFPLAWRISLASRVGLKSDDLHASSLTHILILVQGRCIRHFLDGESLKGCVLCSILSFRRAPITQPRVPARRQDLLGPASQPCYGICKLRRSG